MAKKNTQQKNRSTDNIETGISGNIQFKDFEKFMKSHNARCFMISATQTDNNIEVINKIANDNKEHIKFISSKEAIDAKLILDVDWSVCTKIGDKLDSIYSVIKRIERANKKEKLKRCVLVTVHSQKELKQLTDKLVKDGIDTFSTCCSDDKHYGMQRHNGVEIKFGIDEFKREIKQATGFKVVIHIKQLVCGVDVDCFTDAIIYDMKENDDNNQRTIIQTIGRCLRYLSNEERENAMNNNEKKNLKKFGKIWFIDRDDDHSEIFNFMAAQYHSECGTMFNLNDSEGKAVYTKIDPKTEENSKITEVRLSFKRFKMNMKKKLEEYVNAGIAELFGCDLIINEIKQNLKEEVCYDDKIVNYNQMERLNTIMAMVGQAKVSELEKFLV
ncbi:MAG: hypothetical protein ACI4XR_04210 [Bacilli bacterium]